MCWGCSRSLLVLISCEVNKEEEGGGGSKVHACAQKRRRGEDRMALPEGRRGMETERSATREGLIEMNSSELALACAHKQKQGNFSLRSIGRG
jgi:hypothetical protein